MREIFNQIYLLLVLAAVLTLSSCSAKVENHSEKLSYQFVENLCDTGEHSFSSQPAYCEGLKDEKLNKGCAPALREKAFRETCPNQTWARVGQYSASNEQDEPGKVENAPGSPRPPIDPAVSQPDPVIHMPQRTRCDASEDSLIDLTLKAESPIVLISKPDKKKDETLVAGSTVDCGEGFVLEKCVYEVVNTQTEYGLKFTCDTILEPQDGIILIQRATGRGIFKCPGDIRDVLFTNCAQVEL